jgi:branched-chain amino acid transport system substrate-binding protein
MTMTTLPLRITAGVDTHLDVHVAAALDHAKVAEGPGGGAEMVPGQHHVRMNMYIGRAKGGAFEIVRSLGAISPNERVHAA